MANEGLLEPITQLRLAIRDTRDPALRARLRTIEVDLRRQIGTAVPKQQAARLLGVSVTALERWIERGTIPVVARAGSTRLGVEREPLLTLAVEVAHLRAEGVSRGVLAKAFGRLGWRGEGGRRVLREDVAALPRPNVSARELRHEFEHTTPEERVHELDALNRGIARLQSARCA